MNIHGSTLFGVSLAFLMGTGAAWAITPEEKCEADKNKIAGKYAFCRQKEEAKAIKKGTAPDFSKCDEKYADKWAKAESKAGPGVCPSEGDEAPVQAFLTQNSDDLAVALGGGALPDCSGDLATCNGDLGTCNGNLSTCTGDLTTCAGDLGTCSGDLTSCQANLVIGASLIAQCNADLATCESDLDDCQNPTCGDDSAAAGEQCDGVDLNGATCASLGFVGGTLACSGGCEYDTSGCTGGFPATGETTAYGAGSDGDVQAGAALSYTDNGDGTITDNNTGLMWEKKDDSGGIHDKDNVYTWCGASCGTTNQMDGTIKTVFLDTLNDVPGSGANCFAGYCDWRAPNYKELTSILNLQAFTPAVDPAFHKSATCTGCADVTLATCSCTVSSYWSSTSYAGNPSLAWFVDLSVGNVGHAFKTNASRARAVRGGS